MQWQTERERENEREGEVEKALHLLLLATPTAPVAYPGAFSDGKLGENFSAGCSWGNFVLLFSTFDDFLPNRCRYNAKCSYMPASQPATEHTTSTSTRDLHKESLHPPRLLYCLPAVPIAVSFAGHLHAGRQQPSRQAGSQKYIPSTGKTTKALPKKSC